jgi:hypothetical protein
MRLIVSGSRSIKDYDKVALVLNHLLAQLIAQGLTVDELVEGEAFGVDLLAKRWAIESKILVKPFPADWENLEGVPESKIRTDSRGRKYNVAAGYERNQRMVNYMDSTDLFVAIWDGKSGGTEDCTERARKKGLQVLIFTVKDNYKNTETLPLIRTEKA